MSAVCSDGDDSSSHGNMKRKRKTRLKRKLNVGQRVEVRGEGDGFLGSWHVAEVVGREPRRRDVKYEHILSEDGVNKLIESVSVSPAVDGINSNHHPSRCSIRPSPPPLVIYDKHELPYGLCVDVHFQDAWWEGVIFDFDNEEGTEERLVFFPDLGDEQRVKPDINTLRITMDWDEVTDTWKRRGTWTFLQLVEKYEAEWPLSVSLKQIWYDIREHPEFSKLKDWTSTSTELWEKLVLETIIENLKIAIDDILPLLNLSCDSTLGDAGMLESQESLHDAPSPKPFYCPQAVMDYCMLEKEDIKKSVTTMRSMRSNAKKHLLAAGWKFEYWEWGGRPVLRYLSRSGKYYSSLRAACKGCIDEDELQVNSTCYRGISDSIKNSEEVEDGVLCKTLFQENELLDHKTGEDQSDFAKNKAPYSRKLRRKSSHPLVKLRHARENVRTTRAICLNQRAQPVVSRSSQHYPKTILAWLIENNTISPRAKVFCCNEKNTVSSIEGRANRDGIRCNCCGDVFTLSNFVFHGGRSKCRPATAIFLDDGRSLLECERETLARKKISSPDDRVEGYLHKGENDHICSVCHYGGELILCDQCPSSFHQSCLGLKDVPAGDWFCPSCCCSICGQSKRKEDGALSQDEGYLNCLQCQRKYHIKCLSKRVGLNPPKENWYCSSTCEKISLGLYELLEKPIRVGSDNLTWTLLKPAEFTTHGKNTSDIEAMTENNSRLCIALDVMHECFEIVEDPFTKRDLVEDIIFNRGSDLKRLNFQGFYTVLLEKNDELVSVANVRIYGDKVAEVPLIGTRFQYRRQGMCTILMNELEKILKELGVERLVLPAVPSAVNTWTTSFGFTRITNRERLQLLEYTFLYFQDTQLCQKHLLKSPSSSLSRGTSCKLTNDSNGSDEDIALEGSSSISDAVVCPVEESEVVNQGLAEYVSRLPSLVT